jgi:aryl-alcohol dehydrogenase-like predicted oxidoreductase
LSIWYTAGLVRDIPRQRGSMLSPAASPASSIPGYATPEGTRRYVERMGAKAAAGHFREQHGLKISSIGIGTYLGEPDAATDRGYTEAVIAAVENGVNLIDTAINYRLQRSERSIGAALRNLLAAGYSRDELVLCTKAGFLTADGEMPADPLPYFTSEYVEPGIFRTDEVAAGCHCLAPGFLENQIERSLKNLGVECIDVFYLHNPETQLGEVSRDDFKGRIRAAFHSLESAVEAGKIRMYGLATWNAFRQEETAQDYISLEEMVALARNIASDAHHFRFVQLPFNLAMHEALTRPNQKVAGRQVSMVQAARPLGITLVTSAALLQGQLAKGLPPFVAEALGLSNDRERALQFARSSPGITTVLVGMSKAEHVRANLVLAAVEPAPRDQFLRLFEAGR